ncbi:Transposon Tf2-11 polyprotein [Nymphon striatum]|nr:Transposon Tf2-11 polyprotein [Nymphon striatum]
MAYNIAQFSKKSSLEFKPPNKSPNYYPRNSNNFVSPRHSDLQNRTCFFCHKSSHFAKDCPLKKKQVSVCHSTTEPLSCDRLFVVVKISDSLHVNCLVDTGASISVLSIVDSFGLSVNNKDAVQLHSADSSRIITRGSVVVKGSLQNNVSFEHKFYIADINVSIIGMDLLNNLNAIVDLNKCCLHVPGTDKCSKIKIPLFKCTDKITSVPSISDFPDQISFADLQNDDDSKDSTSVNVLSEIQENNKLSELLGEFSTLFNGVGKTPLSSMSIDIPAWMEKNKSKLTLIDSLQCFQDPHHEMNILVPTRRVPDVLKAFHDDPHSGHTGIENTLKKIRQKFYWPTIRGDVKSYCKRCHVCAVNKDYGSKHVEPMIPIDTSEYEPGDRMAIDMLGPFKESVQGNKYLVVAEDYYTKWCFLLPTRLIETSTIVAWIADTIIPEFGVPREIITDQGPQFDSKVFLEFCKESGIRKLRTSPYHPQTDGMVERRNRTILNMLRCYCHQSPEDWDISAPAITFSCRSMYHETIGMSPFEALQGRCARSPNSLPDIRGTPLSKQ